MKKLHYLLTIILLAGSIFAWYTVYTDFVRFYNLYGTIFRISDCVVPNPVVTPCFYGAFAFVGALIWSLIIIKKPDSVRIKQSRYLLYLLIGSNIFAWSNFTLQLVKFLRAGSKPIIGCSGVLMANPFTTPCFIGSAFFLVALIVGIVINYKYKKLLLTPLV